MYWETAYCQRYGAITDVTRDAATLAKSWKELFRCRTVTNKQVEPRYGHYGALMLRTNRSLYPFHLVVDCPLVLLVLTKLCWHAVYPHAFMNSLQSCSALLMSKQLPPNPEVSFFFLMVVGQSLQASDYPSFQIHSLYSRVLLR